uniref:Uncharacterized protein n=1 Tax=Timema genevievae TaxID=629358 RepID=A0A7R9K667_TIMGE|nr:unnamed protein product [Timema genevievae]
MALVSGVLTKSTRSAPTKLHHKRPDTLQGQELRPQLTKLLMKSSVLEHLGMIKSILEIEDLSPGIQEPCYINVLSWGKISIPRRQDDPVPLYGGMRIPQSNLMANNKRVVIPRRPPIIFAVMINPQILKDSGKTATDPSRKLISSPCRSKQQHVCLADCLVLPVAVCAQHSACDEFGRALRQLQQGLLCLSWNERVSVAVKHNTRRVKILPSTITPEPALREQQCSLYLAVPPSSPPPSFVCMSTTVKHHVAGTALVELVLDFVEGMNPDVQFKRSYQVLQERDLTGELKDIWLAIQLKRDRDKGNLHKTVLMTEDQPTITSCHQVNTKHTEQKEFSLSSSDSSEDEDRSERDSLVQTVDNINSSNERKHFCNTSNSKRLVDNFINQPIVPSAHRKVCHCIVSTDTNLRDENVANNSQNSPQCSSSTAEYPNHPIPVECRSSLQVLAAPNQAKDICDKQSNEPHINETALIKSEMGKAIKLKV